VPAIRKKERERKEKKGLPLLWESGIDLQEPLSQGASLAAAMAPAQETWGVVIRWAADRLSAWVRLSPSQVGSPTLISLPMHERSG
jgi:hypothetical protein